MAESLHIGDSAQFTVERLEEALFSIGKALLHIGTLLYLIQ